MNRQASPAVPRRSWLPPWLRGYRRENLAQDLTAGLVVALMLVPQGLAYAMLAGMPPVTGLYASVLPLLAYALFGSSMTLAVGPVAISALMTAAALTPLFAIASPAYVAGAMVLALLSGVALFLFGALRLGFLAQLMSRPVLSGFTSGAGLMILIGQFGPLLGMRLQGDTALLQLLSLLQGWRNINIATVLVGAGALALLLFAKYAGPGLLQRLGLSANTAGIVARLSPMVVVLLAVALMTIMDLDQAHTIAVVGAIPAGLPIPDFAALAHVPWHELVVPALLIGLIGFIGSLSMAQSLAIRRRERIDADAELRGVGAANIASGLSGGFPVAGGFARSVVNFAAGAQTPLAGIVSALLMAVLLLAGGTGLLARLPLAVLAATIIAALASLVDVPEFRRAWRYDRSDAFIMLVTIASVVGLGVERGVLIGIGLSLMTLLWRTSNPFIAEIGRVPGTEHFRNVERYRVETLPRVLTLRVDEQLFFGNIGALEQRIWRSLEQRPELGHVLLVLSSVGAIDTSAMETLREVNADLLRRGVHLHLAEVRGPVLDRLHRSPLPAELGGQIHMSVHRAFVALADEPDWVI
jgi:SulP family sulfate permease